MDIKKVLVATDFSECSQPAVEYGCQIAAVYQAELHLLHVIPDADLRGDAGKAYRMSIATIEDIQNKAKQHLEELGSDFETTAPVLRELRQGVPYEEVLGYVRDNEPDLLIVGTHGAGMFKRALIGSVAERLVQLSPVPVLTVRSGGQQFITAS